MSDDAELLQSLIDIRGYSSLGILSDASLTLSIYVERIQLESSEEKRPGLREVYCYKINPGKSSSCVKCYVD
jgi:hypothetical protein